MRSKALLRAALWCGIVLLLALGGARLAFAKRD
jgi:hypothetical protein